MPGTIDGTLQHALLFARRLPHCDDSCVILLVLFELGVQPKNEGFVFLKNAVAMHLENPMRTLKNDIYPAVGHMYGMRLDPEQVEQAIRSSIRDAWSNREESVWRLFFPTDRAGAVKRPSNADFIARIAWFVELWRGCCKEAAYAAR